LSRGKNISVASGIPSIHLNDLLEDFLSLGKLEEGKVGIITSSFAVKDFIDDVIDEMKVQAKPGQQIIFEYQGEDCFITDKRMLKNILINLVSNAIKFSGDEKMIRIEAKNFNKELSIVVKDNGLGIPGEDLPHLFSTFFRGKKCKQYPGNWFGFADSKTIC
jgi:signal transduction histidine kinase